MRNASDERKAPGHRVIAGSDLAGFENEPVPDGVSDDDCPVDFTEARAKHLDMLLGVVCQMSGASAATRRYCLCLSAVALPASLITGQPAYVVLMVGLALVFWVLDAGYAHRQHLFEQLYEEVRTEPHDQRPDFRIAVPTRRRDVWATTHTFLGGSRAVVYPLVIVLLTFTGFRI